MNEKTLRPNALGLSCVENYTLSILEKHLVDISCLFCTSYLRGDYLLSEIIKKGVSLKNFALLTRVHEVAFENLSLVRLSSYDKVDISNMWREMKEEKDRTYYLIKVNPSFVSKAFNADLEREDHYICYWFNDGKNNIFNDYPYRITRFSDDEIISAYDGNIITFELVEEVDESTWRKARQLFNNHLSKMASWKNDEPIGDISLAQVEEFLTIYKRILHRTLLYCSAFTIDTGVISQNFYAVDNLITKIKVNELRGRETVFIEDIKDILQNDQMVYETVQQVAKESDFAYAQIFK